MTKLWNKIERLGVVVALLITLLITLLICFALFFLVRPRKSHDTPFEQAGNVIETLVATSNNTQAATKAATSTIADVERVIRDLQEIGSGKRVIPPRFKSEAILALPTLQAGQPKIALRLFEDILGHHSAAAATAARNLGAIVRFVDVKMSSAYFEQATKFDPGNIRSWLSLGETAIDSGNTAMASQAFREAKTRASLACDDSAQLTANLGLSEVAQEMGRLQSARRLANVALTIADRLLNDLSKIPAPAEKSRPPKRGSAVSSSHSVISLWRRVGSKPLVVSDNT